MSYHLGMERKGKVPDIEMPPIQPEKEPIPEQAAPEQQPEQQYEVHPEIAKEIEQPKEAENTPEVKEEVKVKLEVSEDPKSLRGKISENARRAEQAERERDELKKLLMEVASGKQPKQEVPVQEEPEIELAPDDLVEAKHLKKYAQEIKKIKEELNSYKQQSTIQTVDAQLKAKYPDIDKVLSKENLETLRNEYPEIADTINANPNIYNKAVSAYTFLKKMGIAQEDIYVEDRKKAETNAVKPRPLVSVSPQQGESPLSHANAFANGLTDDLKKQLRAEMENARKNL